MSSEINNQVLNIQQLIVPGGTGITNNSSSSLPPIKGALAYDVTSGTMSIGSGTNWGLISPTPTSSSTSFVTAPFNLTKAGVIVAGCTLSFITLTVGTVTFKFMSLNAPNGSYSGGDWLSPTGIIPTAFLPTVSAVKTYLPCWVIVPTSPQIYATYFYIDTTGTFGMHIINSPVVSINVSGMYV